MKKIFVISILLFLGMNYYLSVDNKLSSSPHLREISKQGSHPDDPPLIWTKPDFRKKVDQLSDIKTRRLIKENKIQEPKEEITRKARNIIENKLEEIIDVKRFPILSECRGTVAMRELSLSILQIINNEGHTTEDFIQNENIYPDFLEFLSDYKIDSHMITKICASSTDGVTSEQMLRTLASTDSSTPSQQIEDSPNETIPNDHTTDEESRPQDSGESEQIEED